MSMLVQDSSPGWQTTSSTGKILYIIGYMRKLLDIWRILSDIWRILSNIWRKYCKYWGNTSYAWGRYHASIMEVGSCKTCFLEWFCIAHHWKTYFQKTGFAIHSANLPGNWIILCEPQWFVTQSNSVREWYFKSQYCSAMMIIWKEFGQGKI